MNKQKRIPTEKLTLMALLVALQVVLGNVTQIPLVGKQFNFGFLPVVVAGTLLGIPGGLVVGALGDFIGAQLFPTGAYFAGFTLTSALVGVLYALPLYRQKPSWVRIIIAIALASVLNLFLNSLWLSMIYSSKGYWGWVVARSSSYLVEAPVQIVLTYLALKGLKRVKLPTSLRLGREENK